MQTIGWCDDIDKKLSKLSPQAQYSAKESSAWDLFFPNASRPIFYDSLVKAMVDK